MADLVGVTGLATQQIEQGLNPIVQEYRGHLKVTESGEILYYFPHGMRSTRRGAGRAFRRLAGRVG